MFNQIRDLAGGELYLITSLLMFMVFFIVVTIYLFRLSKPHILQMEKMPIDDLQCQSHEEE